MFPDVQVAFVCYQFGYSRAVGVVHPSHHLDFLGHFPGPSFGRYCFALFDHDLLLASISP